MAPDEFDSLDIAKSTSDAAISTIVQCAPSVAVIPAPAGIQGWGWELIPNS